MAAVQIFRQIRPSFIGKMIGTNSSIASHIKLSAETWKVTALEKWNNLQKIDSNIFYWRSKAINQSLIQCHIQYINRDISANLQHRQLKLGRLIVLQEKKIKNKNFFRSHGNSPFSSSHPLNFNMPVISSSTNVKRGQKLELTYFYACWIMHTRYHLHIWKLNVR